jgi:hypothetical protein
LREKADGCDPGRERQPKTRLAPRPSNKEEEVMSRTSAAPAAKSGERREGGGYRRFLWGGLGALAPTLISLAILDHMSVAEYITDIEEKTPELGGYGFRVLALFVIGGLWAFFHRSEIEPLKLFQLGVVAPAMITGMINASNVSRQTPADESAWLDIPFTLVSSAHAEETTQAPPPAPDQQSAVDQFINGLLGRP